MNILVIGAGTSRDFGFARLRAAGHRVGVIDDLSFVTTAMVDWIHPFSPSSGEAAADAALKAPMTFDAVLCFGEWYLQAAVEASELLGIPGPRLNVAAARQKDLMREAFRAHGMRVPRVRVVTDPDDAGLPEHVRFPVVVKPVDYSSSSGVTLVDDEDGLPAALRLALSKSFRGACLIEEFIDGEEYSVEGIVAGGQAIALGVTRKFITAPPYFVEVGHLFPAPIDVGRQHLLIEEARRAVEAVGMTSCSFHCELKVSGDVVVCIEIAGRSGGDMIPELIHRASGIDLYAAELAAILGEDPRPLCRPVTDLAAAVRFFQAAPGTRITWPSASTVRGTTLGECLVDLKHLYPWYVDAPVLNGSGRRLGYAILAGPAADVAVAYEQASRLAPPESI